MTDILVDMAYDNPQRGDMHGFTGLARAVARRMRGTVKIIDGPTLEKEFPDIKGRDNHGRRFFAYMDRYGTPSILFQTGEADIGVDMPMNKYLDILKARGVTMVINQYNEDLASKYTTQDQLVPHHLTRKDFRREGRLFMKHYPALARPLIGVVVAIADCKSGFVKKLVKACARFRAADIFVSSCPQTDKVPFKSFMSFLRKQVREQGLDGRVRVRQFTHNHKNKKRYNPYVGLLDQADHVIVCGSSLSVVSEALATGKTVHSWDFLGPWSSLVKGRLVRQFDRARVSRLQTRAVPPVNVTEDVARGIVCTYRKKRRKLAAAQLA